MSDVVVVGSGPAGSVAALAARRAGASVVLLDGARFPRDKVCGHGVAPQVFDVLAGLGIDPAPLVAGHEPLRTFRLVSPSGGAARRVTHRPGLVEPREVFDHWLRQVAVAAGVEACRHTGRHVTADRSGRAMRGRPGAGQPSAAATAAGAGISAAPTPWRG